MTCSVWDCESTDVHHCMMADRCPEHCSLPERHLPLEPGEPEAVPEPSRRARVLDPSVYPKLPLGPRKAINKALANGWRVQVTDSCGPWTAANGRLIERNTWSVLLKAQKPSTLLAMLWIRRKESWALAFGYVNSRAASSTEILKRMEHVSE